MRTRPPTRAAVLKSVSANQHTQMRTANSTCLALVNRKIGQTAAALKAMRRCSAAAMCSRRGAGHRHDTTAIVLRRHQAGEAIASDSRQLPADMGKERQCFALKRALSGGRESLLARTGLVARPEERLLLRHEICHRDPTKPHADFVMIVAVADTHRGEATPSIRTSALPDPRPSMQCCLVSILGSCSSSFGESPHGCAFRVDILPHERCSGAVFQPSLVSADATQVPGHSAVLVCLPQLDRPPPGASVIHTPIPTVRGDNRRHCPGYGRNYVQPDCALRQWQRRLSGRRGSGGFCIAETTTSRDWTLKAWRKYLSVRSGAYWSVGVRYVRTDSESFGIGR